MMTFGIYINKNPMENNQLQQLILFIKEKKKFITQYGINKIPNKVERSFHNIKMYSGIDLPDSIQSIRGILDLIDTNLGICERTCCNNKKKWDGNRWDLRKFCGRKCADLDFSEKQKGEHNSFHNISEENRIKMGNKISKKISKKISEGTFTPNITNSWANSKINVLIKGRSIFVRSSWEAYFYLLNPDLMYEFIRIPYFDLEKNCFMTITDSGTVQEELCIFNKPTITIRDSTERPETVWCGSNIVSGLDPKSILQAYETIKTCDTNWIIPLEYNKNNVSDTVVNILLGNNYDV
jgi:hypothetical protein